MRCKHCKEVFKPKYFNQKYHLDRDECIKAMVEENNAKKAKSEAKEWAKEKKERKEAIMTHSEWLKLLQVTFNTFIRLRDKGNSCISCQNKTPSDAGHYKSRGANPELAFNEFNTNLQCRKCNGYWGGAIINYRKGLIKKYGIEVVEWLEGPHEAIKLSVPEIKDKIQYYKNKIKELKNEKN